MWTSIYNLADGHAWQGLTASQSSVVERLGDIFLYASSSSFDDLERQFVETFLTTAQQHTAASSYHAVLSPTASYSIDIVAAFLRERHWAVALVEPCFGHIAKILKRRGVDVKPIPERSLRNGSVDSVVRNLGIQALFICTPNNPTGFELDAQGLASIAEICCNHEVMLIIDRAYGLFCQQPWDHYKTLRDTGVRFVVIEDTGKTWPTLDLKVGFLVSTDEICNELRLIQDEVLLHVSPFVLAMLTEYIKATRREGFARTVQSIVERNREALTDTIRDSVLNVVTQSAISAEWLAVSSPHDGRDVLRWAKKHGVLLLGGEFFYWHNPSFGRNYVRAALMRDPDYFDQACHCLAESLRTLTHTH